MLESQRLFADDLHPRLFFSDADVPSLRAKMSCGIPGRAFAEMLRRCDRYTDPKYELFIDVSASSEQLLTRVNPRDANRLGLTDGLHCLAFAYALTGETRWGDYAAAILRALAQPDGGELSLLNGEVPIAFDLLHAYLSEADRATVGEHIRHAVVEPYRHQLQTRVLQHVDLGTNLTIGHFGRYVQALAAVYDAQRDAGALEEIAEALHRSAHLATDEGGAIYEGPSYGMGDARWLSVAAEIVRRSGVDDPWETEPRLVAMARHWTHLTLPGWRGQNPICDAWRHWGRRGPLPLLLHAHRTGDASLWWAWARCGGRSELTGLGPAPERFVAPMAGLGLVAMWEDDDAPIDAPERGRAPLSRNSGRCGMITMRSGWQDEDAYFALHAAGRTPTCTIHQHMDAGHFDLFALNEAFSIDTGYGDGPGEYHSLVMPNGEDPAQPLRGTGRGRPGGYVNAFATSETADYACVDVGEAWDCRWAYRYAVLVKAPGAEPYVALLDNFNHRSRWAEYHWLMNSEPGNKIELDHEAQCATVRGQTHRLEAGWSYPAAGEYPHPHQLTLDTDEIDSAIQSTRKADVDFFRGTGGTARPNGDARWGAGLRPRLIARLAGYNGLLMTALVPRRHETPALMRRVHGPGAQFGLAIDHGGAIDTIIASPIDRAIDLEGVRGEATLAIARRDASGALSWWAAMDAFALTVDDQPCLPRRGEAAALATGSASDTRHADLAASDADGAT